LVSQPKVAICQPFVIPGGRLHVNLSIVHVLNEMGIVPDLLAFGLTFDPGQITKQFGKTLKFNYHRISHIPRLPQDYAVLLFNAMLGRYTSEYDLLINSSNSDIFLPREKKILSYVFFPRSERIMADVSDIHRPEQPFHKWSLAGLHKMLLRGIYRLRKRHPNQTIVCMTEFTREALRGEGEFASTFPVIYPAIEIKQFFSNQRVRDRVVVTVGRFGPGKRQLEQIKLAEEMPDLPFHIVGFVGDQAYYTQCERYASEHRLSNVHLHPNMPYESMVALLQQSRYFLHTLVNEPFGITAVQATAAGCLPIVHNSGGQRETVNEALLRYNDLNEVRHILHHFDTLDSPTLDSVITRLQRHVIENFDESNFFRKMNAVLQPMLSRS
jgi:glycosyltransferase involved in cell wall biosynthesis